MTSQRASGAPRVSAFKRFAQQNLGPDGLCLSGLFSIRAPMRPRRMGIMQKQLDELHIAIVKPED